MSSSIPSLQPDELTSSLSPIGRYRAEDDFDTDFESQDGDDFTSEAGDDSDHTLIAETNDSQESWLRDQRMFISQRVSLLRRAARVENNTNKGEHLIHLLNDFFRTARVIQYSVKSKEDTPRQIPILIQEYERHLTPAARSDFNAYAGRIGRLILRQRLPACKQIPLNEILGELRLAQIKEDFDATPYGLYLDGVNCETINSTLLKPAALYKHFFGETVNGGVSDQDLTRLHNALRESMTHPGLRYYSMNEREELRALYLKAFKENIDAEDLPHLESDIEDMIDAAIRGEPKNVYEPFKRVAERVIRARKLQQTRLTMQEKLAQAQADASEAHQAFLLADRLSDADDGDIEIPLETFLSEQAQRRTEAAETEARNTDSQTAQIDRDNRYAGMTVAVGDVTLQPSFITAPAFEREGEESLDRAHILNDVTLNLAQARGKVTRHDRLLILYKGLQNVFSKLGSHVSAGRMTTFSYNQIAADIYNELVPGNITVEAWNWISTAITLNGSELKTREMLNDLGRTHQLPSVFAGAEEPQLNVPVVQNKLTSPKPGQALAERGYKILSDRTMVSFQTTVIRAAQRSTPFDQIIALYKGVAPFYNQMRHGILSNELPDTCYVRFMVMIRNELAERNITQAALTVLERGLRSNHPFENYVREQIDTGAFVEVFAQPAPQVPAEVVEENLPKASAPREEPKESPPTPEKVSSPADVTPPVSWFSPPQFNYLRGPTSARRADAVPASRFRNMLNRVSMVAASAAALFVGSTNDTRQQRTSAPLPPDSAPLDGAQESPLARHSKQIASSVESQKPLSAQARWAQHYQSYNKTTPKLVIPEACFTGGDRDSHFLRRTRGPSEAAQTIDNVYKGKTRIAMGETLAPQPSFWQRSTTALKNGAKNIGSAFTGLFSSKKNA